MNAFVRYKMQTWICEAAARFGRADLLDQRVPLAVRFRAAVALLHPEA